MIGCGAGADVEVYFCIFREKSHGGSHAVCTRTSVLDGKGFVAQRRCMRFAAGVDKAAEMVDVGYLELSPAAANTRGNVYMAIFRVSLPRALHSSSRNSSSGKSWREHTGVVVYWNSDCCK